MSSYCTFRILDTVDALKDRPDSNILRASWYKFHVEEKTLRRPTSARALLQAVAIRRKTRTGIPVKN